uniref:Integrase zinc-binding domain-containing protein n=1 Tax=Amphimedon queenslandica TaxID=400682 RepID=A0A1X7VEX4_AMPQE
MWRCCGRISYSDFSYATKQPIVQPSEHPYASTIKAALARIFHLGVKETLTELRPKYWVVKARLPVRNMISSCNLCRRCGG